MHSKNVSERFVTLGEKLNEQTPTINSGDASSEGTLNGEAHGAKYHLNVGAQDTSRCTHRIT